MAGLPPSLQGPTAKEKKYDRQLRLWGAAGQQALEDSHILLINSGPGVVGLETLKNLVLPGIGQFTIHDEAIVTEADLGVNFFLEERHLGGSRAQHTCELLTELNPDVKGHYITTPINTWLDRGSALSPYTFILVTAPISPKHLEFFTTIANDAERPLFYVHSIGFYSHLSIHLPPAFPVVDTHPDPETTSDLRLLKPWPELSDYATTKTAGIENMSADDHGHIPYIALLLHFIEAWKKDHGGKAPQNYKDKTAFRELVSKAARTNNPEGGEENFDEAVAAVIKLLNPPEVSSAVRDVFKDSRTLNLTAGSQTFWKIARAIGIFYDKYGVLPVPGAVPDMKARSVDYIQLQNVYKAKARKDLAEVIETLRSIEKDVAGPSAIEEKHVEAFCKNAAHVKLIRGRPFHIAEHETNIKWGDRAKALAQSLTFPDTLLPVYIVFLAWDKFVATHRVAGSASSAPKIPGDLDEDVDADGEELTGIAFDIIRDLVATGGASPDEEELDAVKTQTRELAQEFVRAGGSELHNISALTGGFVSQEAIKVITEQYIPLDNTCIFDGIRSRTEVFRV